MSDMFSENLLKWVGKGPPGLSRGRDESKLRSESNGMPPGPQNGRKKIKNPENTLKKTQNLEFGIFPIGPYREPLTPIPYRGVYYI